MNYISGPVTTEKIKKTRRILSIDPHLQRKTIILRNKSRQIDHTFHCEEFDKNQEFIKLTFNQAGENDQNFFKNYHTIQSQSETKRISNNFSDLIKEYKKKGYKIPNLTLNHNLFNQNALLLPENKLYEYYCCYKKKDGMKLKFFKKFAPKRKDKALNFIEKENEMLNNKITELRKTDIYEMQKNRNAQTERNNEEHPQMQRLKNKSLSFMDNLIQKTMEREMYEENKKIYKQNKEIAKLIPKIQISYRSLNTLKQPKTPKRGSTFEYKIQKKLSVNPNLSNRLKKLTFEELSNLSSSQRTHESSFNSNTKMKTNIKEQISRAKTLKRERLKYNPENLKRAIKPTSMMGVSSSIIELAKEDNQSKFIEKISNIKLNLLSKRDFEYIAKAYCSKFLNYNESEIEQMLSPRGKDHNIEILNRIKEFVYTIKRCDVMNYAIVKRKKDEIKVNEADKKAKSLNWRYVNYLAKIDI